MDKEDQSMELTAITKEQLYTELMSSAKQRSGKDRNGELLKFASFYEPNDEKEVVDYYARMLHEFTALTPLQQEAVLAYLRAEQKGMAA